MNTIELEIESVELVLKLKEKNVDLYNNFIKVYHKVKPLLNNRISQVFKYYTLHDVNHSTRIMFYMGKLVPDLDKLNAFELVLLAYSALLHDIGMAASEEEINEIKNGELRYKDIEYQNVLKKFGGDHEQAIQDYIRIVHAYRSAEYIKKFLKAELVIPNMTNTTFEDQVALICQAHTEDFMWIKDNLSEYGQKGEFAYNSQFCAIILRLADILDFDSHRTPPILFESIAPKGISKEEWIQHFAIENINKVKQFDNGYKFIELHGRCSSPVIHRKILSYINWINSEINNANELSRNYSESYRILLHPKVYDFIKSDGYTIADMKFRVNYNQITKLLMGENLYGNKNFGLRELIQNSIDACNLKKEILDKKHEFGDERYKGSIKIILDQDKNEVSIKDNGIGMNMYVLKNYFLKLGASFYNSDDYSLKGYSYNPIGNYGIGFLACFMLSDEVKVKTRHMKDLYLYEVDLNKFDEFVSINHNTEYENQGTEVILKYDQFMSVWGDFESLEKFLNSHFLTDDIQIQYINKVTKELKEINNKFYDDDLKHTVDLSKYLNEIQVQATLNKDLNYIFDNKIEDIGYKGEPIIFNGEDLLPLDEYQNEFNLLDFIVDKQMQVLNFPLIENEGELNNIIDVIDDMDEAFDNYIARYNPTFLTIIAKEGLMIESVEGFVREDAEILPNLYLSNFANYGHDYDAGTIIELEDKIIYNIDEYSLFLTLKGIDKTLHFYQERSYLFVRNVFLKKFNLDIPFKLLKLSIKDLKVNIINDNIKPNVTRNDLNENDMKQIKHAIYVAICFHIYENLKDPLKKQTLLGYLKEYQKNNNRFIKKEYVKILMT
ncbi:ATP-binding protein [Bacillus cereus]|uniref:HD domain-containing protein n=1 Tax=Bacillus cereus group TaxID=86661 RepID=UPI000BF7707C|nr:MULTISPECIES: ATP-binding protein [Bacillus cereus group]MDA2267056.1 ATP-binding protein [Bacillus cereus]MDC7777803.1 ATP-binding protein [Bacillus cereus]MED2919553.1 ATP-binding protein [Bacillus thuringiensis]MED2922915.1 ATP-binding protein [Bacillus thuringiensis]MED3050798.1 ATP-binding protein [Bacillus thuringiensis]